MSDDRVVLIVCGPGPFVAVVLAKCPWCWQRGDRLRRSAFRWVYSGMCGADFVCGRCGQSWNPADDGGLQKLTETERAENIALVKKLIADGMKPSKAWPKPDLLEKS